MGQMAFTQDASRGVKTIKQVYNVEASFIIRAEADLFGQQVVQIGVSHINVKAEHVQTS